LKESISANDLSHVIKAHMDILDYTLPSHAVTRYLERVTKKRVTFAALVLAMLRAGFAAVPTNTSIRFLPVNRIPTSH